MNEYEIESTIRLMAGQIKVLQVHLMQLEKQIKIMDDKLMKLDRKLHGLMAINP